MDVNGKQVETDSFGIIERDPNGTVFLPWNLAEQTDDDLEKAIELTYAPPWVVDGGFGWRALADIREALEEAQEVRSQGQEAIDEWMEQARYERDERAREMEWRQRNAAMVEFEKAYDFTRINNELLDAFRNWVASQSQEMRDLFHDADAAIQSVSWTHDPEPWRCGRTPVPKERQEKLDMAA